MPAPCKSLSALVYRRSGVETVVTLGHTANPMSPFLSTFPVLEFVHRALLFVVRFVGFAAIVPSGWGPVYFWLCRRIQSLSPICRSEAPSLIFTRRNPSCARQLPRILHEWRVKAKNPYQLFLPDPARPAPPQGRCIGPILINPPPALRPRLGHHPRLPLNNLLYCSPPSDSHYNPKPRSCLTKGFTINTCRCGSLLSLALLARSPSRGCSSLIEIQNTRWLQ